MSEPLIHRPTKAQWKVLQSPARYKVWVAGRRCGKTTCMVLNSIMAASKPRQTIWYVAPYRNQAEELFWEPFKEMAAPLIAKANEAKLSARLKNGSVVSIKGADNPKSLVGRGLDGLMVDEAGDVKQLSTVLEKRLTPALADKCGWMWLAGSPQGRNAFYDLYKAAGMNPGWDRFLTTTLEGGLVTPEEIEERRRNMAPKHFASEFEASFDNQLAGRTYYCYDPALNMAPVEYNPQLPLCWAMDFNIGFMCSVIAQTDGDSVRVLDELFLPDTNLYDMCAEFVRRIEANYRPHALRNSWEQITRLTVRLYGDSTGKNRSHAGPSDWSIVREQLAKVPWITVENRVITNPEQKDRIQSVNAMLCSAANKRRLIIAPHCKALDADFEKVQWAMDSSDNILGHLSKKEADRTHISDAVGYLIWAEHGIKSKATIGTSFVA